MGKFKAPKTGLDTLPCVFGFTDIGIVSITDLGTMGVHEVELLRL